MPRTAVAAAGTHEHFRFAVTKWTFDYGFHVNRRAGPKDILGICWDSNTVLLSGPLLSKTKRRCDRVNLTLRFDAVEPDAWRPEWKGFGKVVGVRRGAVTVSARLPTSAFLGFVTALAAGKVQRAYLGVEDVGRGGVGVVTSFFTVDPDDDDDDDDDE